ncbi:hypothetical protein PENSPDRAFT_651794 [Peniophora sp. CONT]|nr:hypothetical protein PENSPDRAFT_651794 [Peniophora sp. CONT]
MPNLALLTSRRFRAALVRLALPTLRITKRKHTTRLTEENPSNLSAPLALAMAHPITVPSSSTASTSSFHTRSRSRISSVSKAIAKDTLLLGLDALAQSADAFPPLKSAVGGLLFIVTMVEASP